MHKPILPIQVSNTAPAAPRHNNGPDDGGARFNQALTREIDQRNKPAPAAAKPNGPAKPAQPQSQQAQQGDKAGAPKKAGAEPARVAKEKPAGKDGAAEDSAAQAAAAAVGHNPVVDMLALVASFNQPGATAAPADAAATDPLLAGSARLPGLDAKFAAAAATAGIDKLAAAGAALLEGGTDGGAPAAVPGVFNQLLVQQAGGARDGVKADSADGNHLPGVEKAALGKDFAQPDRPLDAAATAAAAKAVPDPAQFANLRARDAAPDAGLVDVPVSAPAAAPVQQASLALTQAANGVGAGDKIAARVGSQGWDNQVAQKVVWMVAGKEQSASLTLNPPDLGPMQVVLNVTNDLATVTFSSATPEVRQALEDAMPKLREMMSESGIALGNASVNDGSAQRQAQDEAAGRQARGNGRADSASGSAAEAKAAERPARTGELPGLVDTFA